MSVDRERDSDTDGGTSSELMRRAKGRVGQCTKEQGFTKS